MANHLSSASSPYLLQHAHNPVDWYPWGETALQKARSEDKPIFLSIGYAACHWCHVMAHESFEDPAVAAILREHFIAIKVDREERPDLDSVYMSAVIAMTGQGGWPMSVFLTPDGRPFYGGTYFPPTPRFGMPSFRDLLLSLAQYWKERRPEIERVSANLTQHLQESNPPGLQPAAPLSADALDHAVHLLLTSYDQQYGGWGRAPKFPAAMTIQFLLQRAFLGDTAARDTALHALKAMNRGGIFDVVAGGFHRYSTDNFWRVPHFEKMLYDNALLARAYLHAYLLTQDESFRDTAVATLEFIQNEMTHPAGGFYSSLDADSEGEEGKYYLWTVPEIEEAIPDPHEARLILAVYHVTERGNFEGRTIFQKLASDEDLADSVGIPLPELRQRLTAAHHKLNAYRLRRVRPQTDDKILAFWNALALQAFAEAGRYLNRPDFLRTAQNNAGFIQSHLIVDGQLMRSHRQVAAPIPGFLEDYAAAILAFLALYQADFNPGWYQQAARLAEQMLARFTDPLGGFYDSPAGQDDLLIRPKTMTDNAVPSGSALAAQALLALSAFDPHAPGLDAAQVMLASMQASAAAHPTSFSAWLQALQTTQYPLTQLAVLYPPSEDEAPPADACSLLRTYHPFLYAAGASFPPDSQHPPLLANRPLVNGLPTAYLCQNYACRLPTTDLAALRDELLGMKKI